MRIPVGDKPSTAPTGDDQYAAGKIQLRNSLNRCARLMTKADEGTLNGNELNEMFLIAISMRKKAWELGVTNLQLELMLEEAIRCSRDRMRFEQSC